MIHRFRVTRFRADPTPATIALGFVSQAGKTRSGPNA